MDPEFSEERFAQAAVLALEDWHNYESDLSEFTEQEFKLYGSEEDDDDNDRQCP